MNINTGETFATNPKNVAQERDFNSVDLDGVPPDALEQAYGNFEGELAPILKRVAGGDIDLTKEEFDCILNLVALLAIRNPRHRDRFSEFQDDIRQRLLEATTATKERWENHVNKARAAGYMEGVADVPYEVIRRSIADRDFKFVTTTTEHAQIEVDVLDTLLQVLGSRHWRWLRAGAGSGGFITCDHPVALFWDVRPKGLAPLGFGLKGTTVLFPISPSVALEGSFEYRGGPITLDAFCVGDFNLRLLAAAHRQIYSPNDKFLLFDGSAFFGKVDLIERIKIRALTATPRAGTRSAG
ncbi:hypothetical protein JOE51_006794 [Bradyrhizobium japonicum]|nr:hypothetical protein [Bradyrhizobium japonicum]